MGGRLLDSRTTSSLTRAHVATGMKPPYTDYGYGVWIDRSKEPVSKHFVEGSDPGVALRSAIYHDGHILTLIGNTGDALWPLVKRIESTLDI
jgi:hypothetical protein